VSITLTYGRTSYNPKLDQPAAARRILALDVGKKRIGLAVSDELGLTAQGLDTLERSRLREDLKKLGQLAQERNVSGLLVGKPLHMSGEESRQSEYTREFAARLAEHTGLPVIFWDERLTSAEAERMLRAEGATLEQRKKAVDRMAAVLLLESYLAFCEAVPAERKSDA
jgi:putative Holliday junction resolvase